MNRNFKDKLKEVVYFTLCLVFLLAIAYFSGFLKGFTFDDFAYTYQKLVYTISKNVDLDVDRANILSTGNSTARKTSSFNNYRLLTIPQTVINGAYDSNTWLSVFRSNKKVVFYVYDPSDRDKEYSNDFYVRMTSYLNNKNNKPYYSNFAVSVYSFKNIKNGAIGPEKICNSLEECNQQRVRASNYSNMADFFTKCARTMCIINPSTEQFVILKDRNFGNAVSVLNSLREW